MPKTIQELAREAFEYFVLKERTDGEAFWTVKDNSPPWVRDMCFKAHDNGEVLPDDWRYRFIVESLETLSECDDKPISPIVRQNLSVVVCFEAHDNGEVLPDDWR